MKIWKLSRNFQISSMKYYRTHAIGKQLFYLTQTFVNGICEYVTSEPNLTDHLVDPQTGIVEVSSITVIMLK